MSRLRLSHASWRSLFPAVQWTGTSHLVENLVDRFAEIQAAEQSVHRVIVIGSLPQKNGPVTKLELHDRPCHQSKLFAKLYRNRELPLGGHRALHRE